MQVQEIALDMSEVSDFVDASHKDLLDAKNDEAHVALNYVSAIRGMSQETILANKVGYCSTSRALPDSLSKRHYGRHLWGRVVIPIFGEFGELVSFATRSCTPAIKGWWHIPFHKRNYLFLFDKSRRYIFEKNKVYIVEGFMDALLAFQHGVCNVASVMGTELSNRRIGFISRYCNSVCLCFDTDINNEAGQEAQLKSIAQLTVLGTEHISQIKMPEGIDPDVFLIENGATAFYELEKTVTEEEQLAAQKWLRERND